MLASQLAAYSKSIAHQEQKLQQIVARKAILTQLHKAQLDALRAQCLEVTGSELSSNPSSLSNKSSSIRLSDYSDRIRNMQDYLKKEFGLNKSLMDLSLSLESQSQVTSNLSQINPARNNSQRSSYAAELSASVVQSPSETVGSHARIQVASDPTRPLFGQLYGRVKKQKGWDKAAKDLQQIRAQVKKDLQKAMVEDSQKTAIAFTNKLSKQAINRSAFMEDRLRTKSNISVPGLLMRPYYLKETLVQDKSELQSLKLKLGSIRRGIS